MDRDYEPWLAQSMGRCLLKTLEALDLSAGIEGELLGEAMAAVADLFLGAEDLQVTIKEAGRLAAESACAVLGAEPPNPDDRRHALAWEALVLHLYNCSEEDVTQREARQSEDVSASWALDTYSAETGGVCRSAK